MAKVKVCGLRRLEDIEYVNKYMPDYIGFIFVEGRRRYISPENAFELKKNLDSSIKAVGVFLDDTLEKVIDIANSDIIDIIQLHGNESEEYISELRKNTDKQIIKVFSVKSKQDIDIAVKSSADYIMLDNGNGGTGKTFDWNLCKGIEREYFVAGGLDKDNVNDIIKFANPFAVDVSSGVETDNVKDSIKIQEFISCVRNDMA